MRRLTVLYDPECALCQRAWIWLNAQRQYVRLEFIPAGSELSRLLFPTLTRPGRPEELVVVSDEGGVYKESAAWIMCLWALKKYRGTALRLATPELMPSAKRVIAWVSRNRFRIGQAEAWKTL